MSIIEAVNKCVAKANAMYNLDMNPVIDLKMRGSAGGQAVRKAGVLYIRLNAQAIREYPEHIINDTIPHEIAHLVCYMLPRLGRNHDAGWKRVAQSLGCSGDRCHTMDIGLSTQYTMISTSGVAVKLSKRILNKILKGQKRTLRSDASLLTKDCVYFRTPKDAPSAVTATEQKAAQAPKAVEKVAPAVAKIEGKAVPKPSKKSAEIYSTVNGSFELFAIELYGKSIAYIKSEFKRAAHHA
ncbi:MAG: hypothetical protein [Caudoviricetes sp.]|nr:MAG: hypothetical protein [Caudoviricetes sp.]